MLKKVLPLAAAILVLFGLADFVLASASLKNGVPIPVSPSGQASIPGNPIPLTSPTLTWRAFWSSSEESQYIPSGTEVWYEWRIGTTAGSSDVAASGEDLNQMVKYPGVSKQLSVTLTPGQTYYWAVKAKRYDVSGSTRTAQDSSTGESLWSDTQYTMWFSTLALNPPIITSPVRDDSTGNPVNFPIGSPVTWTPGAGSTPEVYGWELWQGTNKISSGSIQGSSISLGLQAATTYTFKVKAGAQCNTTQGIDINNCSTKSDFAVRLFTTQSPALTVPALISPAGDVNNVPFDLKWQKVIGATTYQWQLKEAGVVKISGYIAQTQPCSGFTDQYCATITYASAISNNLKTNTPYSWTAQACRTDNSGTSCTTFAPENIINIKSITQSASAPTITSFTAAPPQFTTAGGGTVNLSWTSTNANTLTIDQGVGTVTPVSSGQKQVSVTRTTTFTITAIGTGGQTAASITVTVAGTTPIPTTLPVPINLYPTGGTSISANGTLSWQINQTMQSDWMFDVRIPASSESIIISYTNTLNPSSKGITLVEENGYSWKVQTCKKDWSSCSGWSDTGYFVVSVTPSQPPPTGGTTGGGGFFPNLNLCASKNVTCNANEICNPLCVDNFQDILNVISGFIFWLAIIASPILILIGAFYILISGGDVNKFGMGRRIIQYTLIGLAIVLLSRALVSFFQSVLGVKIF